MRVRIVLLATALAVACSGAERAPTATTPAGELAVLRVDSTPALEIGMVEGNPDYAFESVVAAVRLQSGALAVADRGAARVSVFGPDGKFVRRLGGRGDGPGEFRDLVGLYLRGDTIEAADGRLLRILVFDSAGAYVRQYPSIEASRDSLFPIDSWLHARFWALGARDAERRQEVRRALDALPLPPGYRMVRVAVDGSLWIREPAVGPTGFRSWVISDAEGRPTSVVDLPPRFEPLEMRGDAVTGVWRDENEVNFVRVYALTPSGETRPQPEWLTPASAEQGTQSPLTDEEFAAAIKDAVKKMAVAQEIHYGGHRTYTPEIDSLKWERPEGIEVDFAGANERGWAGVFSDPKLDRICALGYGDNIPGGWSPGRVLCAPPRTPEGSAKKP